jgi:hypothetical protein
VSERVGASTDAPVVGGGPAGLGTAVSCALAGALADRLAAGRARDYERCRRASRTVWIPPAGLLCSRHHAVLTPRIVPAAQRLPYLCTSVANQVAQA